MFAYVSKTGHSLGAIFSKENACFHSNSISSQ